MAIKVDIDNTDGQTYGYWMVEQYTQNRSQNLTATVVGYKNKATRDAGKTGWVKIFTIDATTGWQLNMTMSQIEAAVMALPDFAGATTTA